MKVIMLVPALLAAAAAGGGGGKPAKSAAKAAPAPTPIAPSGAIEAALSDAAIEALLKAAAPFDETMEQEVGALGFTKTVQVKVHLTNPRVKVSADGVHVTVDYHLQDDSGVVDTVGTATPLLVITPVPAKEMLEATFARSGIELLGVEVPLETLVDPIEIPAAVAEDVDLGDRKLATHARVTEVVPQDGRVLLKGTVSFSPEKTR